ncbi:ATP synthase F1 subunit gamma [uncultured Gemmiger sp.]|uniref:ATP synthase F1 subunit gamma n=1 Tax=uncultured Gemmiger sp. TaxID=1623490 RepID=UPI0025CFA867|nr:ATP synthase F1 subunit gamma [uncultured Gemmiger sp.]
MPASMKEIKLRIKSVQGTRQLTKAMELVASSKLRRASDRVEHSRPYFETLYQTLCDMAAADPTLQSPYLARQSGGSTCYIVIAGDRGLAGGYNANVFRAFAGDNPDGQICVLPIGRRAVEHFERQGIPIVSRAFAVAGELSVSDCFEISRMLCGLVAGGQIGAIRLVYTRFVSMLAQKAQVLPVLPFIPPAGKSAHPMLLYEPDSETVFNAVIPEYLAGIVYGALCESVSSELAARRTAMDSASRNASDMIDRLSLNYNRARQAAITRELTEIVAGADAGGV